MKTTVDSQIALRNVLREAYIAQKNARPQFTQAKFAQKIGLNPAVLSEVFRGKRNLSKTMAKKILQRLEFSETDMQKVLDLFENKYRARAKKPARILTVEEFALINRPACLALLALIETDHFRSDRKWIASRLGITTGEAEQVVNDLIRVGLLEEGHSGALILTHIQCSGPDGIPSVIGRQWHHHHLDMAKKKIEDVPIALRDFTTVTMAIDPERLEEAYAMVRQFRRKLAKFLEGGKKLEVYVLGTQLFPLSKEMPGTER